MIYNDQNNSSCSQKKGKANMKKNNKYTKNVMQRRNQTKVK